MGFDGSSDEVDLLVDEVNPEVLRAYHSGAYKAPHVPSYLGYFFALGSYCLGRYQRSIGMKLLFYINSVLLVLVVFLSGSRTPITAFILSLLIVNIRARGG